MQCWHLYPIVSFTGEEGGEEGGEEEGEDEGEQEEEEGKEAEKEDEGKEGEEAEEEGGEGEEEEEDEAEKNNAGKEEEKRKEERRKRVKMRKPSQKRSKHTGPTPLVLSRGDQTSCIYLTHADISTTTSLCPADRFQIQFKLKANHIRRQE